MFSAKFQRKEERRRERKIETRRKTINWSDPTQLSLFLSLETQLTSRNVSENNFLWFLKLFSEFNQLFSKMTHSHLTDAQKEELRTIARVSMQVKIAHI
jgi:hypothetical protein